MKKSLISLIYAGYNHPALKDAIIQDANVSLLAARPAMGMAPPANYVEQLKATLLSVSLGNTVHRPTHLLIRLHMVKYIKKQ